jgi:CRP-like cAMP-binding protein
LPNKKRGAAGNLLLDSLQAASLQRLIGGTAPVELRFSETLSEPGDSIHHAYFPIDSFISLITPGEGNAQLEIGLAGNEGMLGIPLMLGVKVSPLRALVQGAGTAWCVDAAVFLSEMENNSATRTLMHRYLYVCMAQLMQTASCTRFHLIEARLARWLLMTRDRAHASQFHVTHEFLALMLGVRRVGVTRAASALQRRKLINYARGEIEIMDARGLAAASCTCYAADRRTYARLMVLKPTI